MKEETLFNLIKLYYENIDLFTKKNMRLEDLINEYKKSYANS
jgi:TRAP-type uncharacterized transport system substrate-binding protein